MVIFLNGSVNSGKTTVAGVLKARIPNSVVIDDLGLVTGDNFARIEMAEAKLRTYLKSGMTVLIDGQVAPLDFLKLKDALSDIDPDFYAFTLRPRLEIATRNRGDRILSQQEVDQVKQTYEQGMDDITYGQVLDNSDESPEQTAERIMSSLGIEDKKDNSTPLKFNELTAEEARVIEQKGTEMAFTGEYDNFYPPEGVFICRKCNTPLFDAKYKFKSGCGWPSFDEYFEGKVLEVPDADGRRTEIVCATCGGHLGHVFRGERLTDKDTRHCVNSLSIKFKANE